MSILVDLISKDYRITGRGRWLKTREHDSLVIDTEEDIFFWNSRTIVGDALVWLTKVKGLPYGIAQETLKEFKNFSNTSVHITRQGNDPVVVYPKLVDVFWKRGEFNRQYWYDRNIHDDTIDRFRLGYSEDWFLIPFFEENTFKNFQMRRDLPEKRIKNWYTGVGPLMFNSGLLNVVDKVIITEGPVDAILLNQKGIPAVSHNGGSGYWNKEWKKFFFKLKEIYIVYDNDLAGRKGALRIAKDLGEYDCKIYTFEGFNDGYDVVDFFRAGYNKDQFLRRVYEESKYCFELS